MTQPWYGFSITQGYGKNGEKGVDLGTPFHTPITSLYGGTVRWAGRTEWSDGTSSGGEVTIVCNVPGYGIETSYYLHLDEVYVKSGDTVTQGQIIGLSGGQLSGGNWPVKNGKNVILSTGPHTEFGFNAPWVSGPGSQIDPTFAIYQARSNTLPIVNPDGSIVTQTLGYGAQATQVTLDPTTLESGLFQFYNLSSTTQRAISQPAGFDGICEAIDAAQALPEWNWYNVLGSSILYAMPLFTRAIFMVVGSLIAFVVIWSWIREPVESGLGAAAKLGIMAAAPEAAPVVSMTTAPKTKAK